MRLFGVDISLDQEQHPTNVLPNNDPEYIYPSPEIVADIKLKGGTDPVFLFEKKLANSDVEDKLNRIFIPRNRVEKLLNFLTQQQRHIVLDESATTGIEVPTIDQQGYEYIMHLKKWHSLNMIVLNHEWKIFYKANELEKGNFVQCWGYYQDGEFRLALTTRKTRDNNQESGGSSSIGSSH